VKILLRNSPDSQWQKLEPFEFGGPDGEKKLETLLEESPDLLSTEWDKPILFFKSQVPIGSNAVDLLGVDEDGMIVMVECKLDANREVRRAVVGQILEYAGQLRGMSYEEFDNLLKANADSSLVETAKLHIPNDEWSGEAFRAAIKGRLEAGDFRLVIAINGMNEELKVIVEYLRGRGVRLEALELQRFWDDKTGVEVLVPEIYGLLGRATGTSVQPARPAWDWGSFAEDAAQKGLEAEEIKAIEDFYECLQRDLGAKIRWGSGASYGYFGAYWPFSSASPVGVSSNGRLGFAFVNLQKTEAERAFRVRLRDILVDNLSLTRPIYLTQMLVQLASLAGGTPAAGKFGRSAEVARL